MRKLKLTFDQIGIYSNFISVNIEFNNSRKLSKESDLE
jgi:hypothetical protein